MISIKKPKNFQGICNVTIWGHAITKERMQTETLKAAPSDHVLCLSSVLACLPYFFKGKVGVLKLCLGYLSVKWLFQVFLNLAVNWGQIPRWSHSDFTTSGHYFSSFQVPPPSPTQALMPDPEVRAGVRPSKPGSPIGVIFVKWLHLLSPPSSVHSGNKELADSKGCCEEWVGLHVRKLLEK